METLSSSVGYGIKATSVKNNRRSIPGISNTHTWDSALPVRSPTSLSRILFKKVLESSRPFIYISALPSCTNFTAVRDACTISGSLMISYSARFMPNCAAISRIIASSPTRIASAMPRSLAAFTASNTALSCAAATDTTFLPQVETLDNNSSKFLLIWNNELLSTFVHACLHALLKE